MRFIFSIFALSLLVACSHKTPAPICKIDATHKSKIESNAGCFIQKKGKVLLIRQRYNSKLSFPGGTHEEGETAQCTAHRETWEEAGMNVTVGRTLYTHKNKFYLFECDIQEDLGSENLKLLKTNDPVEIIDVLWVDPKNTSLTEWRYSPERALSIELLGSQQLTPEPIKNVEQR